MLVGFTEFNDYIADPGRIKDPVIRGGAIKMLPPFFHEPWRETGGFCIVAKYEIPGGKSYAVRCWHSILNDVRERTIAISDFLKSIKLPYFVDFAYIEDGFMGEKLHPIVRMEWVEGLTLNKYIEENLWDSSKIYALASRFSEMCIDLIKAGISHGDLNLGNIIVRSNGHLVLLDYDSLYHNSFGMLSDYINGKREFQHPTRVQNPNALSLVDNFSALVIYTSLLYFAVNPNAFLRDEAIKLGDRLLFSADDYVDFASSKIYAELRKFSPQTRFLANELLKACRAESLTAIHSLPNILEEAHTQNIYFDTITPYIQVKVSFVSVKNKGVFSSNRWVLELEATGEPPCDLYVLVGEEIIESNPQNYIPVLTIKRAELTSGKKNVFEVEYKRKDKRKKLIFRIVPSMLDFREEVEVIPEIKTITR